VRPRRANSQTLLSIFNGKTIQVGVIYVDLVESTDAVSRMKPSAVRAYYTTFTNEMIQVIIDFGGYFLKPLGDAVVGFFPAFRGFVNQADNVVNCGLIMIELCKNSISPFFVRKRLPKISCRVGADFGTVEVVKLGVQSTGHFVDIVGNTMNIAAKIMKKAGANELLIGDQLSKVIHTTYRLSCSRIGSLPLPAPYAYYKVDFVL